MGRLNKYGEHSSDRIITKSSIPRCTPYEVLHGAKLDMSNMTSFGCKAFVHMPKEKQQGKLNQRILKDVSWETVKEMPTGILFRSPGRW